MPSQCRIFKERLGVKEGEDIGENSLCCALPSTETKREAQRHLDLGVVDTDGPTVIPLRNRKGQRQLASLSRSREKEKWLCWGDLCCLVVKSKNACAVSMAKWARGTLLGAKNLSRKKLEGL